MNRKIAYAIIGAVAGVLPGMLVFLVLVLPRSLYSEPSLALEVVGDASLYGIPALFLLAGLRIAGIADDRRRRAGLRILVGLSILSALFFLAAPFV
jgi:hypothetical protein